MPVAPSAGRQALVHAAAASLDERRHDDDRPSSPSSSSSSPAQARHSAQITLLPSPTSTLPSRDATPVVVSPLSPPAPTPPPAALIQQNGILSPSLSDAQAHRIAEDRLARGDPVWIGPLDGSDRPFVDPNGRRPGGKQRIHQAWQPGRGERIMWTGSDEQEDEDQDEDFEQDSVDWDDEVPTFEIAAGAPPSGPPSGLIDKNAAHTPPSHPSSSTSHAAFRVQQPPRPKRRRTGSLENQLPSTRSRRGQAKKRKRRDLEERAGPDQGYPDCTHVGNIVQSCFPTNTTQLMQGVWSKFIWNANEPTFIGAGGVDIYLYDADSEQIKTSWTSIANGRGSIGLDPGDVWWAGQSDADNLAAGTNLSHPFFFVIVPTGQELTGGESHLATFTAIQTALPQSVVSSRSSASVASASSASMASMSSLGITVSNGHTITTSRPGATSGTGSGSLNSGSGDGSSIPHWAIAVIVVLGFFALLAAVGAAYAIIRYLRRHREASVGSMTSHGLLVGGAAAAGGRDSEGSGGGGGPAVGAGAGGDGSGRLGTSAGSSARALSVGDRNLLGADLAVAGAAGAGAAAAAGAMSRDRSRAGSARSGARPSAAAGTDGNGEGDASRAGAGAGVGEEGALSGAEAALMAEAFRKALRKPDFPGDSAEEEEEEGSNSEERGRGEQQEDGGSGASTGKMGGEELLRGELASEGKEVRRVPGRGKAQVWHPEDEGLLSAREQEQGQEQES